MRIKVKGELVYSETYKDWTALEEACTRDLTLKGKPAHEYAIAGWEVAIAIFVVGHVYDFIKDAVKTRKEEKKYKQFLELLEQQVDRIVASKSDIDPEQLYGRALVQLVNLGEVSIELETDVERDLLRALNLMAAARPSDLW